MLHLTLTGSSAESHTFDSSRVLFTCEPAVPSPQHSASMSSASSSVTSLGESGSSTPHSAPTPPISSSSHSVPVPHITALYRAVTRNGTTRHQELVCHLSGITANLSAPLLIRLQGVLKLNTPAILPPQGPPPPPPLELAGIAKVVGHQLHKIKLPQNHTTSTAELHFIVPQIEQLLGRRWSSLIRHYSKSILRLVNATAEQSRYLSKEGVIALPRGITRFLLVNDDSLAFVHDGTDPLAFPLELYSSLVVFFFFFLY